jgi:hypothetical protein
MGLYFYSYKCLDAPISAGIRASLLTLRLIFLFAMLYLLTRPLLQEKAQITHYPTLYIAIDDTQSMAYPIHPMETKNTASRMDSVLQQIQKNLGPYWRQKGFETRYLLFSESSRHSPTEASWISSLPRAVTAAFGFTDIGSVIASFDEHRDPDDSAYLLLFSDGAWNQGSDPASLAAAPVASSSSIYADRRIYTFGLGTTQPMFDLKLHQVQLPATARENETLQLVARIDTHGPLPTTPVSLQVQGQDREGKVVFSESQPIPFDPEQRTHVLPFVLPPLPEGDYMFTAEIPVQGGELFAENNRIDKGIRIRKNQDQILMLTSAPGWDFKFLKRVFEDQAFLDIRAYLNQGEALFPLGDRVWVEKQTSSEPGASPEVRPRTLAELSDSLSQVSLIVLYHFAFSPQQEEFSRRLRTFIENGGAVLFLPGEVNSAVPQGLQSILPPPLSLAHSARSQTVLIDPATPSRLLAAWDSSQIERLPPLSPLYLPTAAVTGGTALLTGRTSSAGGIDLVKLDRFGLGRIVSVASPSFWRWDMQHSEPVLAPFWLAVLYQCRPQLQQDEGRLTTDGFLYEMYQPMQITYTAKADIGNATVSGIPVVITTPSRSETLWLNPSELGPNRFETRYIPVEAGDYQIAHPNTEVTATVRVEANAKEMNELQQNVNSLRSLAERSGGEYANYQAWNQLRDSIPNTSKTILEERTIFLGEKWWAALILVFFLGMEWFLRWRKGLP